MTEDKSGRSSSCEPELRYVQKHPSQSRTRERFPGMQGQVLVPSSPSHSPRWPPAPSQGLFSSLPMCSPVSRWVLIVLLFQMSKCVPGGRADPCLWGQEKQGSERPWGRDQKAKRETPSDVGVGAAGRWENPAHLQWLGFCSNVQGSQRI